MMPPREQELEDELELLKQQLSAVMGSSKEVGVLMTVRCGMTQRLAQILHILVQRAPAIVSRNALHAVFYGSRDDGGPEPKIFSVYLSRLRDVLARVKRTTGQDTGKIETTWNSGYKASPELVRWVKDLYKANIEEG